MCDTVILDTCHSILVRTIEYKTRVNPDVNYGLWVTIMCQSRSVSCSKGRDVGPGRLWSVRAGAI